MSANTRWLSVLVMQKYKERVKTQQDNKAGLVSWVGDWWQQIFGHNVQLQVLLHELTSIAHEVSWPDRINPFEQREVFKKLLELDLTRGDTVKFLQDLISCFEKAYANPYYQTQSTESMKRPINSTEERYRQDTANSLIYLYVIPNLLLQLKNASSEREKSPVQKKLDNVQEIIEWDSNCFFRKWFTFAGIERLKLMAESLFDDNEKTRNEMAVFKRDLQTIMINQQVKFLMTNCQTHVRAAYDQIFDTGAHNPFGPHVLTDPDRPPVSPELFPVQPTPVIPINPLRDDDRLKDVRCMVTKNPYLVKLE